MNVIQRLTLQTLKKNRRRTVVTILGTAVAVAMVTAIAVLVASMMDMLGQSAIKAYGPWHTSIREADTQAVAVVEGYENLDFLDVEYPMGYAPLPGQEGKSRSSLWVTSYSAGGLERLPITLLEGRLPAAENELVVDESFLQRTGYGWQVGDTVSLDFGYMYHEFDDGDSFVIRDARGAVSRYEFVSEGERQFTIVGMADLGVFGEYGENYTAVSFVQADMIPAGELINLHIGVQKPGISIYDEIEGLLDELRALYSEGETVRFSPWATYNDSLLMSSGITSTSLLLQTYGSFFGVLLAIVLIGSVSLIRNAFSISLSERVRALGMLAGVGATRRQKRQSVMFEALVVGLFAIPLGILGGILGIGITLYFVGGALGNALGTGAAMRLVLPGWVLVFTVLFSALILLLSAVSPARRAAKISPIAAMRGLQGKEKAKRPVRVSPLVARLLGYEAELGMKNSKRNRKRYYAVLSSLVISVVLFLTVSSAMGMFRESFVQALEEGEATLTGYMYWTQEDVSAGDIEGWLADVRTLPGGEDTTFNVFYAYSATLQKGQMDTGLDYSRYFSAMEPEGTQQNAVNACVMALDEESFLRYSQSLGVEVPTSAGGELQAIVVDTMNLRTQEGGFDRVRTTSLVAGDSYNWEFFNDLPLEIQVAQVAEEMPGLVSMSSVWANAYTMVAVVRLSEFEAYAAMGGFAPDTTRNGNMYSGAADAGVLYEALDSRSSEPFSSVHYTDVQAAVARNRQLIGLLSLFSYGFVVLITMVCLANIFNTVSTGIALRVREFSMLRSMGLTPKGFNKMLNAETLFYGLKALLYGIPISLVLSLALRRIMMGGFTLSEMRLPLAMWGIAALGVFLLVGSSTLYARRKVRRLNIAEALKNENW